MSIRSFMPVLLAAFAGVASAQASAPAEQMPAEPAAAASAVAPATAAAPAAAPAASGATKTAAAPVQRCHKEYPTGSNLPKTVCESEMPSDLDQMRQRELENLKHTVTPGVRGVGSGG
jgi:hypothetical protein